MYTREELKVIADLCIKYDTVCISDEVYEWLVYTGHKHIKIGTDYDSLKAAWVWAHVGQLIGKDPRPALKIASMMGIYVSTYKKYLDGRAWVIKVQLDEQMFKWGKGLAITV